ncbi:recombinase family protein [Flavobacterium salilacus subsp. salilacus]|uniref:recombinase family protein n=1 Tax=Flavobacterium TaxID=237 RepID=UPI001074FF71|nr:MULTISPECIES: recombinase family protein [Flavobacterium]KAF2520044.1 recombinase family protein [Flavobacterium salilacus subsp. salilacus]MBE1614040.1 recombinase family protein [Flavobacterium sp. SaA2.13]
MIGIYCRISRIKDGNDLSIEDQKQKGVAKAKALGLSYQLYIDEGLSGASEKIEDRPEFQRFIADVSIGKLTHVYAYDQSRFERNPQIRFVILDLFKKHNIKYFTHLDGQVDLHDPQQEFFGDLLSVINKYHVTTTKIKVKSALTMRAKEGKGKGTLPFGYKMDNKGYIIINEEEAHHVKKAYQLSNDGMGCNGISHYFNENNIPTVYSRKAKEKGLNNKYRWSPSSIRNLIVNTFYKGERIYNGEKLVVPAIIDPIVWQQVNDHLPLNANSDGKKISHRFLLSNVLYCNRCAVQRNKVSRMYGRRNEKKSENSYLCSSKRYKGEGCDNKGINISKLDAFIWEHLFLNDGLKQNIEQHFAFEDKQKEVEKYECKVDTLQDELATLQKERSRAISLVIKGTLTEDDIAVQLASIDRKIKKYKKSLDESEKMLSFITSNTDLVKQYTSLFEKFSEETSFEEKRSIITKMIKKIMVEYDSHWQEYYIEIHYTIDIPSNIYAQHHSSEGAVYYRLNEDENSDFSLEHKMKKDNINTINNKIKGEPTPPDLERHTGI